MSFDDVMVSLIIYHFHANRFVNVGYLKSTHFFIPVIIMTNEVNCVEKCSHICNTTYFLLAVRKLDTTLTLLEAEGVDMRCLENLFGNLFHRRKCIYLFFGWWYLGTQHSYGPKKKAILFFQLLWDNRERCTTSFAENILRALHLD